jgi:hypothetical protein
MQTIARSSFITVKTEGGILPADLLQRLADGLKPADYHARSFQIGQDVHWNSQLQGKTLEIWYVIKVCILANQIFEASMPRSFWFHPGANG